MHDRSMTATAKAYFFTSRLEPAPFDFNNEPYHLGSVTYLFI